MSGQRASRDGSWSIAAAIPTYNRAALVARAIESVLAQRRPADEIVVVDDGSTDETEAVVRQYGDRVTYVRKANGGASSARNRAVEASGADFVAFLDSDDVWYPKHLAQIDRAIIATGGDAALYFSDLELVPPRRCQPTAWRWSGFSIEGDHAFEPDAMRWMCRSIHPMMIQSSVVRRDAYVATGGCDTSLPCREDTHLFFKLALEYPFCAVAGVAGVWSDASGTSLTRTFSTANETYWLCTVRLYADVLESAGRRLPDDLCDVVTRRLADGHFMLARTRGAHAPWSAARHLHAATRTHPRLVATRIVRSLARTTRLP